jgi:kinesin family protein 2/24
MHAASFIAAIQEWRDERDATPPAAGASDNDCAQAYVRKRPLFDRERARGEFDCVSVGADGVTVHACCMRPDLRAMYLRHVRLGGGGLRAFGENVDNGALCAAVGKPLISAATGGSHALLLLIGQTGSGKTHSAGALEAAAAAALLDDGGSAAFVTYVEVAGRRAFDLLADCDAAGGRSDIATSLRESGGGCCVPSAELSAATRLRVSSAAALAAALAAGRRRRSTSSTAANAQSSRSHALLRLALPSGGSLTIVDLAGSERRQDSDAHDAAQRRSGAEINASLFALAECLRARAAAVASGTPLGSPGAPRFPYRASLLTRLLARGMSGGRLAILATLSPAAADAEHCLTTLHSLSLLGAALTFDETEQTVQPVAAATAVVGAGAPVCDGGPRRGLPLVQWRPTELRAWLAEAHGGAFAAAAAAAPAWMAGRDVARMTLSGITAVLCGGDARAGGALRLRVHPAAREQKRGGCGERWGRRRR